MSGIFRTFNLLEEIAAELGKTIYGSWQWPVGRRPIVGGVPWESSIEEKTECTLSIRLMQGTKRTNPVETGRIRSNSVESADRVV